MEFNAQITKVKNLCINRNTCRNTPDFMCDLELFSKIQSHNYRDNMYLIKQTTSYTVELNIQLATVLYLLVITSTLKFNNK